MKANKHEFDFFDRPKVRKGLWIILCATCLVTVLAELFLEREGHFAFDGFFGFYALLGFLSCAVLILAAKALGSILKAREDFYDDDESS